MSEIKLKPCPWCGGEMVVLNYGRFVIGHKGGKCNIMIATGYYDAPQEAADAWNNMLLRNNPPKGLGDIVGRIHMITVDQVDELCDWFNDRFLDQRKKVIKDMLDICDKRIEFYSPQFKKTFDGEGKLKVQARVHELRKIKLLFEETTCQTITKP